MPTNPAIIDAQDVTFPALALSIPAAAEALGISDRTMHTMAIEGRIKTFRVGSRRLVSVEALRAFIAQAQEGGR